MLVIPPFLEQPLFYQPIPYYGKILNLPPFWENLKNANYIVYPFVLSQHKISELTNQVFLIFCVKLNSLEVRTVTKSNF